MSETTQEIPSIELLKKLIVDNQYFFEFANCKEKVIYGFEKKLIVQYLKEYIRSIVNSNDKTNNIFLERAKYYNDKFNMEILYFRNAQDGLDKEFYELIMNKLSGDDNQKAYKIYERLAKELEYDAKMTAYEQNLNNKEIEELYYAKTSSVTLKNRKITCKNWAEIYVAFLTSINIKARTVREGKHYYVLINLNNIEYKADATNSFLDKDNIYINDLTRIKLNTPACGYFAPKIKENKRTICEQYYDYLKEWPISKFVTTGDNFVDLILSKIDYLNTIIYSLPHMEAVVYLNQLCSRPNKIFSKEESSLIKPVLINTLEDKSYITTILLVIKNKNDYIYRLLHIPEGLIEIRKEFLFDVLDEKQLENIPGFSKIKK